MSLEVGMYVRTNDGKIGKYIQPDLGKPFITNGIPFHIGANYGKYSFNIKELLVVGDFVDYEYPTGLGMCYYKNVEITEHLLNVIKDGENNHEYKIASIVTKEQLESMSYRVGE